MLRMTKMYHYHIFRLMQNLYAPHGAIKALN